MRRALPLIALVALAVTGCGSDQGLDFDLRTPPPYVGAAPVAPPGQQAVDRRMTQSDARRFRPVIADWAAAVRRGDLTEAANYFDLPAVVSQPNLGVVAVNSPEVAQAFNAALPCGAKLLATSPEGRYVVATFVLVTRGQEPCPGRNKIARVGFVFGDRRHPRQFTEFWQLANKPDASGPTARPKVVTPATVADFG